MDISRALFIVYTWELAENASNFINASFISKAFISPKEAD